MAPPFGSRALLVIGIAIAALLASLAVVQYRWSTRVSAADEQREKEHLESAATLFATEFNGSAGQLVTFLQNDAWAALQSREPLTGVPKLASELYYLDMRKNNAVKAERLGSNGLFAATALPEWIAFDHCASVALEQPPALVTPIFNLVTSESRTAGGIELRKSFNGQPDHCFVARIDVAYLRETLLPKLIRDSFGGTAADEYEFAVMSRSGPIYGKAVHPDLKKAFFSIEPMQLSALAAGKATGHATVFIRHVESTIIRGQLPIADLFGAGIWELDVAHKGEPLSAAFEQRRRRDFLLSLGVEVLLLAAMAFLVVSARRMQDLANRKMRFVAGVSHELRTPVAAIAMLSRNQADGLVQGSEKVQQYGELIHQQSRRLNEMVEQALQFAGIHSGLGRAAKNSVDLAEVVREAVEARREELTRGGFEVEMALSANLPAVPGDAKLLRTAFDNLIDNAQKYAGSVRSIRVSADYDRAKREVWIQVEDRGVGIDSQDQSEIFEPFCRGRKAVEAQIPGSGIGLSLVRSAAEAHRGRVTLESEPGRGSAFTMHLPV